MNFDYPRGLGHRWEVRRKLAGKEPNGVQHLSVYSNPKPPFQSQRLLQDGLGYQLPDIFLTFIIFLQHQTDEQQCWGLGFRVS